MQDDRYTVKYLIKSNVKDIIGFGSTDFNSLKIVYVDRDNVENQYEIKSVGTNRLGLYEFDLLQASEMTGHLNSVTFHDSRNIQNAVELSPNFSIANGSSNVTLKQYETIIQQPVELSPNFSIANGWSQITLKIKRISTFNF